MERKIHNIKSLLNAAKAITEKYNFKIENYILEVSVKFSEKKGLDFWINYSLDDKNNWIDYDRYYAFGKTPELALIMWEQHIRNFFNLEPIPIINNGDFNF